MLSNNLQLVAIELITEFGSNGLLNINGAKPNPITGEGGTTAQIDIKYYREYYESRELVEGLILNGDAKILTVLAMEPKTDYSFVDDTAVKWGIVSITPIEAQGLKIVYEIHIRK